jgi:hypothetical protein
MLHRPKGKTSRLKGDLPIFRRHYRSLFHVDPAESPDYYRLYLAWLRFCGVEPKTGKMTNKGLAVLKSFLDQETVKRGSRRRTGH